MRVFTVMELAAETGRSKQTIYRWIYEKGLPTKVIGSRARYITEDDFKAWLKGFGDKANQPINFSDYKDTEYDNLLAKEIKAHPEYFEGLPIFN